MESERLVLLPKTPVVFEGTTYNLVGDFEAMIEAESYFNLQGHQLNLATAIFNARDPVSGLKGLREVLPCALHTLHPELDYWAVQKMIDKTVACENPVLIEAIGRMWPVGPASSQEVMAGFFERLPEEWKQRFFSQVIAERWPGAAQA